MAASSLILINLQVADRTPLKMGGGILDFNKKVSPTPGIKLFCGLAPHVKRFLHH
jgi:hypothetical protein